MLFNSFSFLLFFLPAVLIICRPLKGQTLLSVISLSSFVFYAFAGHAWFLIPMIISTVMDFYLGPRIAAATDQKKKRGLLIVSITVNLGILCYFKYSGLLLESFQDMATMLGVTETNSGFTVFNVILPAGISFYTFQTISYIIDVYRGDCKPERNFWKFAGFVSFFPHLVAGPLTRHYQLIPQLDRISKTGMKSQWQEGFFLFTVGLSKKVLIADPIFRFAAGLFANPGDYTMLTAWMAALAFTVYIYFDFSGYTDMAIGLGRLFGIELPQNFKRPYIASDPSDFWKRWHITLSRWLKDYLYISLGGNRCSPLRRNFNLLMTMFLGGLWHGANWTFAIWGIYHGLLLIIFHAIEKQWRSMPLLTQRGLTFFLIMIGWVFFQSPTLGDAFTWIGALFGSQGIYQDSDFNHGLLVLWIVMGLGTCWFCPNGSEFKRWIQLPSLAKFCLGMLLGLALVGVNHSSSFLYFQF